MKDSAHTNRSNTVTTQAGDLVLLVGSDGKRHMVRLIPDRRFHTHHGTVEHNDLIDLPFGTTVYSQLGHPILLFEPSLEDRMLRIKRNTQIIYPKDAAQLIQRLSLRAGSRVIEAGTGSGGLTIALAWTVAPTGTVYTYEVREDNHQIARANLDKMGLLPHVEMYQESILDGFRQTNVDALVLDVRTPWIFLDHVRAALRPGSFFGALVPTTNQVSELLAGLEANSFADIVVEELLLRRYKPVPDRLRPDDTMVGHTGFLITARPIIDDQEPGRWLSEERKRYQARKKLEEQVAAHEARREPSDRKYPKLPLP